MQPVEAGRVPAVTGSDLEWRQLVDANVSRVWRMALGTGLAQSDAAQVCQLAWLRLSQRWGSELAPASVADWLDETVRREAMALLGQQAGRSPGQGAVVIPLKRDQALMTPPA